MAFDAKDSYRFGDLLALARRSWIRRICDELAWRGHPGYRVADATSMRIQAPHPIGTLVRALGITRQAERKLARQLQERGYATTASDPGDARKAVAVLTDEGRAYAKAIIDVIASLNRALAERVGRDQLVAADLVLRAALGDDEKLAAIAERSSTPTPVRERPSGQDMGDHQRPS